MKLTIVEFRKQIREAFNAVERHEEVYITRHNKTFQLVKSPVSFLSTGEKSINIRPDIQKNKSVATQHTPKGKNGFYEIGVDLAKKGEDKTIINVPACCFNKKPCKHWEFNSDTAEWVNSISGERKEVV